MSGPSAGASASASASASGDIKRINTSSLSNLPSIITTQDRGTVQSMLQAVRSLPDERSRYHIYERLQDITREANFAVKDIGEIV
ncbi:hypothetical protein UCRNP2_5165 [Neofusicoccum parvum UCRNP2]|uniref:Uncharacterized protein n=1 Tax=Botryosphaeria parva (strain UCR-NP2) TaxID=1287680 RepID=R1EKM8_BOTPV|nr:hypothetical protein UCRNP2_5165 [Neofusicoccum parvum UCRNP2]